MVSGGGGNDFVGAGLLGGMIRAERYLRSSSSDAYDLRTEAGVLVVEERGGSESENEPPPKVRADVGVGVRDLEPLLRDCEEEDVRVTEREDFEFIGEDEERLEEDASSNAGKGEKEDGIVSCGGCVWLCVDSTGDGDAVLVDGLGVRTEGGVGDLRGVGAAGDFLRRLKRGILRLALEET